MMVLGVLFAYLTTRLIVAHVTDTPYETCFAVLWPMPVLVAQACGTEMLFFRACQYSSKHFLVFLLFSLTDSSSVVEFIHIFFLRLHSQCCVPFCILLSNHADPAARLGARLVARTVRSPAADLLLRLRLPRPALLCLCPLCRVDRPRDHRLPRYFVLSHQIGAAAAVVRLEGEPRLRRRVKTRRIVLLLLLLLLLVACFVCPFAEVATRYGIHFSTPETRLLAVGF